MTASLLDKVYLGSALADLDIGEKSTRITRVNLIVDGEKAYTAGDDSGRTIEKNVPWASQPMANAVLASLRSYDYQPFSGTDALLDPAAEMGDGITVGGIYSVLAQKNVTYGKLSTSNIAAPSSDEVEEEYPYTTKSQRQSQRQLAQTYSRITKTSEQIILEVRNDIEGLSASIDIQLGSITSRVTGLEGSYSSIEQYAHSLTLSVSNGSTSSTISLKAGDTVIDSENITFSGFVTFSGLSGGTTTIDGACIKTGTISANRLELTGAITWGDLSYSVQNDISNASITASSAYGMASSASGTISGWTYSGTTYIDGSKIQAGTVEAGNLIGGTISLKSSANTYAGHISLTSAISGAYAVVLHSNAAVKIEAASGNAYMESSYGTYIQLEYGAIQVSGGDFRPGSSGSYDLGQSSLKWKDIYSTTGSIITSDAAAKHDIEPIEDKYIDMLDLVEPVRYKYNDGTSGRYHTGFIANKVETAMKAAGVDSSEFGGFVLDKDAEGNDIYMLRYEEFIALLLEKIRRMDKRLKVLEGVA